jgi:signal transduction histidine kinase
MSIVVRPPPAIVRRIVALSLALSAGAVPAVAAGVDAPPAISYALAAWSNAQSGDVFAIAQDLDGYLWLGTPDGLVRFDGTRFQRWAKSGGSTLPASPVPALASSSQGGVWASFGGGGGVARIHRGGITSYSAADGAPPGVNALLEDRRGTVWAATGGGLFRYAGNRWSHVTDADGYDGGQAFSVYEDRAGRVWIGAARGLYRHDGRQLHLVDSTATYVESLIEDDAGDLWVTDRAAIVRRLGTSSPVRLDPRIRLPLPGYRIISDRGGLLVASFSGGLFRVANPTGAHPLLEPVDYEHRMRGSPRALYRDRDDNIWLGMRGGLLRLSETTFQSAGPLDGLNHDGVRTAAVAADGSIWIATTQALNRLHGGSRQSYAVAQTRALHADRSGAMWVATDDLVGRHVRGRLIKERIPDVQASRVNGLTTTADALWLCTAFRGVLSWDGNTLTSHRQPGQSGRGCASILADRHDRVWAGFSSGGVALHENGRVRTLTEQDGLAPGMVLQIVQGNDDAVWFATSGGVSRYQDGRFTSVTTAHAPIAGVVPVLVEDAQDYVWVGVHSGAALMRFHASEMDKVEKQRNYHLAYTLYDESDGLQPGTQLWQSGAAGVRDLAGQIWVVDGPSMTIIDPRQLREARRASLPNLETVTVNGERVNTAAVRRFANGSTVQFEYAALSLSATSKLRFRHLLEGADADWVYDADGRRATYANLPAGDYRFRVSATEGGQWTEPSLWTFTVDPPFYLSRWVLIAAGTLLAGAIAAAARLRVRAVKTRYALVIAERTRVSREIHDTLLQSLAALGPQLEALATRVASREDGITSELRRLRRQVDRSVRDARESIIELRRHSMGTPRLAESLAQLADDTEAQHGVRPTVAVAGRRPDNASPDVDLQLFRIAQEAVTNAIHHGRPTHIDISVSYDERQVALTIADDGCGFDAEAQTTAPHDHEHFGLVTMRERAEHVGGGLRIESAPGTGTTVHAVAGLTNECCSEPAHSRAVRRRPSPHARGGRADRRRPAGHGGGRRGQQRRAGRRTVPGEPARRDADGPAAPRHQRSRGHPPDPAARSRRANHRVDDVPRRRGHPSRVRSRGDGLRAEGHDLRRSHPRDSRGARRPPRRLTRDPAGTRRAGAPAEPEPARAAGPGARGRGHAQQGDRRGARYQRRHDRHAREEHLHQAQRARPHRRRGQGDPPRHHPHRVTLTLAATGPTRPRRHDELDSAFRELLCSDPLHERPQDSWTAPWMTRRLASCRV